ncbi:U11/U12 small nuclear ribonucleoprotein 48 kDa protein-like isoform X1 [Maniola hyperantus]|uniref:U11/U12 small nuclear ribonucleoprotein 48 kDa protein-like isoform X1 n=1 Tax=Aphantopus hyperantus TaxID=2795564 RepID=UPI003748B2F6
MSSRQEELSELQNYIKEVDKEVTMILQSLQWDRKQLLQSKPKRTCKFDTNHKVPPEKLEEHEAKCALKSQGYADDDMFLPDVLDTNSSTVLKLSSENIKDIINYASKTNPVFIRGDGNVNSVPQTVERLQATYTADERRAIYDVVIHSRPSCDELADLAVGEVSGASQTQSNRKSKLEQMAEMRDMRRRRAKYKVAVRSRNYSNTLRGVIQAQVNHLQGSGRCGAGAEYPQVEAGADGRDARHAAAPRQVQSGRALAQLLQHSAWSYPSTGKPFAGKWAVRRRRRVPASRSWSRWQRCATCGGAAPSTKWPCARATTPTLCVELSKHR